MKHALATCLLLAALVASAADFPWVQSQNTQAFTLLSTASGTNTSETGSTNYIERNTWHTLQIVAANTNATALTVAVQVSLDATNWAPAYSLTFTNTASTNVWTNIVGKFQATRVVMTGTNATATVFYLGQ